MATIECRDRGTFEEGQAMKFSERIRDVVFLPVNLANPIGRRSLAGPGFIMPRNHMPTSHR